jgi:hypothetical protein
MLAAPFEFIAEPDEAIGDRLGPLAVASEAHAIRFDPPQMIDELVPGLPPAATPTH